MLMKQNDGVDWVCFAFPEWICSFHQIVHLLDSISPQTELILCTRNAVKYWKMSKSSTNYSAPNVQHLGSFWCNLFVCNKKSLYLQYEHSSHNGITSGFEAMNNDWHSTHWTAFSYCMYCNVTEKHYVLWKVEKFYKLSKKCRLF